ncbi:MAG: alpha/beta fold hydrolase [Polyangiales bacterium]
MSSFSTKAGALLALFVLGCGAADGASESSDEPSSVVLAQQAASTIDIPVTVKGTGSATLKNRVYPNPTATETSTTTVIAVPSSAASGRVFEPLTAALLADAELSPLVKQAVILDLPGHGESTLPTGVKYGDVNIDDNVDIVIQALEHLSKQGATPSLLVGHGTGALYIASAQQKLLAKGSSLSKLGVRIALFYSPVPSHGRPWTQPPQDPAVNSYFKTDEAQGTTYNQPAEAWVKAGFTSRSGVLAAGAPSAADVTAKGFIAPEPLATILQLTETAPATGGVVTNRPSVDAGIFAGTNRTVLITVAFSESASVAPTEVADFYQHLTGDATQKNYVTVDGADAVGSAHISAPAKVLEATRKFF